MWPRELKQAKKLAKAWSGADVPLGVPLQTATLGLC